MAEVELFNDQEDIPSSKIILSVYPVKGGFLPNWHLEVRDDADMSELLALREGIELVRVQYEKMLDLIIKAAEDD